MSWTVTAPKDSGTRRGFTLIELLVVVGVAAILVPVIINAKGQAKQANCSVNLRNLWLGLSLYCEERGGGWVRAPRYLTDIFPYGRSKGIFLCPSDPRPRDLPHYPVVIPPLLEGDEDEPRVDYPVSYYYARHEPSMAEDDGWQSRIRRYPRLALVVCLWHGERLNMAGLPPFPYYVGKRLVVRTDGSISIGGPIPGESDPPHTLISTHFFLIGGRE